MTYQLQTDSAIVKNYYCRIKSICEETRKAKLQIKDRVSGKQKNQVYSYQIKAGAVVIPELSLQLLNKVFLKTSTSHITITPLVSHELTPYFFFCNKEVEDFTKDYTIDVLDFWEAGLVWKYLVLLQIVQKETNKILQKSFFCSIQKKDTKNKRVNIFLTHFSPEEIENIFKTL